MRTLKRSWFHVRGQYSVEMGLIPGTPPAIQAALPAYLEGWELVIQWQSSGYYDPGVRSGPAENCYPPEGDEERTFLSASMWDGENTVPLDGVLGETLFEICLPEIRDQDLPAIEPE